MTILLILLSVFLIYLLVHGIKTAKTRRDYTAFLASGVTETIEFQSYLYRHGPEITAQPDDSSAEEVERHVLFHMDWWIYRIMANREYTFEDGKITLTNDSGYSLKSFYILSRITTDRTMCTTGLSCEDWPAGEKKTIETGVEGTRLSRLEMDVDTLQYRRIRTPAETDKLVRAMNGTYVYEGPHTLREYDEQARAMSMAMTPKEKAKMAQTALGQAGIRVWNPDHINVSNDDWYKLIAEAERRNRASSYQCTFSFESLAEELGMPQCLAGIDEEKKERILRMYELERRAAALNRNRSAASPAAQASSAPSHSPASQRRRGVTGHLKDPAAYSKEEIEEAIALGIISADDIGGEGQQTRGTRDSKTGRRKATPKKIRAGASGFAIDRGDAGRGDDDLGNAARAGLDDISRDIPDELGDIDFDDLDRDDLKELDLDRDDLEDLGLDDDVLDDSDWDRDEAIMRSQASLRIMREEDLNYALDAIEAEILNRDEEPTEDELVAIADTAADFYDMSEDYLDY